MTVTIVNMDIMEGMVVMEVAHTMEGMVVIMIDMVVAHIMEGMVVMEVAHTMEGMAIIIHHTVIMGVHTIVVIIKKLKIKIPRHKIGEFLFI